MRTVLSLFLLSTALSSSVTYAQAPRVQAIEIIEFGIYQKKTTQSIDAPGTAMGTMNLVADLKLIQTTTTIPARLGITFGYRYKVIGSPAKARVTLKDVDIVPPPGLRNPATGNTILREEARLEKTLGETSWSTYTLDHEWELLPGTWTFQLWAGDRKLAEQKFTLVKP